MSTSFQRARYGFSLPHMERERERERVVHFVSDEIYTINSARKCMVTNLSDMETRTTRMITAPAGRFRALYKQKNPRKDFVPTFHRNYAIRL